MIVVYSGKALTAYPTRQYIKTGVVNLEAHEGKDVCATLARRLGGIGPSKRIDTSVPRQLALLRDSSFVLLIDRLMDVGALLPRFAHYLVQPIYPGNVCSPEQLSCVGLRLVFGRGGPGGQLSDAIGVLVWHKGADHIEKPPVRFSVSLRAQQLYLTYSLLTSIWALCPASYVESASFEPPNGPPGGALTIVFAGTQDDFDLLANKPEQVERTCSGSDCCVELL